MRSKVNAFETFAEHADEDDLGGDEPFLNQDGGEQAMARARSAPILPSSNPCRAV